MRIPDRSIYKLWNSNNRPGQWVSCPSFFQTQHENIKYGANLCSPLTILSLMRNFSAEFDNSFVKLSTSRFFPLRISINRKSSIISANVGTVSIARREQIRQNAVDGLYTDRGTVVGQCSISDDGKHSATQRVDLGRVVSINHINIYYMKDRHSMH